MKGGANVSDNLSIEQQAYELAVGYTVFTALRDNVSIDSPEIFAADVEHNYSGMLEILKR